MTDRTKITKRMVDALKPKPTRYTSWDSEVAGFGMRVTTTGHKTYVLKYRAGGGRSGRVRWAVIGAHGSITPDQARDTARAWAAEVAAGGDPAGDKQSRREAPTVSEALDRYLADHVASKNKPSTAREVERQITTVIRPALGRLKMADVTPADISKLHSGMARTPYAANRALALLSKLFKLAEVWGMRPNNSNPCSGIERYKEKGRERFLSQAELARLGDVLVQAESGPLTVPGVARPVRINPQAIPALRLLIFTGARSGEILGLRWEWINWEAGRAELPDSKGGAKHLHFPPAAITVLRGLDRPENGRGFVIRGGKGDDPEVGLVNLKDSWGHIRTAAGLADVRPHDLRHSFASAAVSGGMSLPLIGALLGHKSVATTKRYAHLASDPLQEAAQQIGNRISSAMQGADAGADVVPFRKNS